LVWISSLPPGVQAGAPERRAARIAELLDLVQLPADASGRLPHEFSGGQRQRIAIARALAVEPELLIADEIVSSLDVPVQAQILNLLLDLQGQLAMAILFVSHDLRLVRHIAHRIANMYLGCVVELGSTDHVFAAPRHPYTQVRSRRRKGCDRRPARRHCGANCHAPWRSRLVVRSFHAARWRRPTACGTRHRFTRPMTGIWQPAVCSIDVAWVPPWYTVWFEIARNRYVANLIAQDSKSQERCRSWLIRNRHSEGVPRAAPRPHLP
jgi:ABC transporter